jgi:hypothetical protein
VYLPKDCDGSNKLIKKRFFASFMVATIAASSLIALSNTASAADRTVTVWTPHTRAWQVTEWKAAVARIQAANPQINIVLKTGINMDASLKPISLMAQIFPLQMEMEIWAGSVPAVKEFGRS